MLYNDTLHPIFIRKPTCHIYNVSATCTNPTSTVLSISQSPSVLCHKCDTTQDENATLKATWQRLKDENKFKKKTVQETTQLLNYKTVPGKHKWKAYNKALKYLWKEYDPKRKALGCCLQTRSEKQTKYPLRNESWRRHKLGERLKKPFKKQQDWLLVHTVKPRHSATRYVLSTVGHWGPKKTDCQWYKV